MLASKDLCNQPGVCYILKKSQPIKKHFTMNAGLLQHKGNQVFRMTNAARYNSVASIVELIMVDQFHIFECTLGPGSKHLG